MWKSTRTDTGGLPFEFTMRSEPPAAFCRRLHSHNWHVLLGSFLALLAALVVWALLYFLGQGMTLGVLTFIHGDAARLPDSFNRVFAGFFLCTIVLRFLFRNPLGCRRLKDRPILGWHLVPEILLFPASLVLAISENFAAYRKLDRNKEARCWLVFTEILRKKRIPQSKLGQIGLDPRVLEECLLTLQLCGLLDLHRGRDDWFYLIPSSEHSSFSNPG